MSHEKLEAALEGRESDDYVTEEELEQLLEVADIDVIERSALEAGSFRQPSLISVSLSESTDSKEKSYFKERVQEKIEEGGRDIQVYQLWDDEHETVANKIEVWIHGFGYSAFAYYEN